MARLCDSSSFRAPLLSSAAAAAGEAGRQQDCAAADSDKGSHAAHAGVMMPMLTTEIMLMNAVTLNTTATVTHAHTAHSARVAAHCRHAAARHTAAPQLARQTGSHPPHDSGDSQVFCL